MVACNCPVTTGIRFIGTSQAATGGSAVDYRIAAWLQQYGIEACPGY
jgi:long-subunit acyl-CoA synthetase (AMP-forming)